MDYVRALGGQLACREPVFVKGFSGLRQTVTIGPHQLLADEVKDVGSNDEGPDPYEYLLAALGTCTNMTLRM